MTEINKMRNQRGNRTVTTEIHRIVRNQDEQVHGNKLDNLELNKFLDR